MAGRYVLGTETWDGTVNADGERVGVQWEPLFVTDKEGVRHTQYFPSEKVAIAAFNVAIAQGQYLDGRDPGKVARKSDYLRQWRRIETVVDDDGNVQHVWIDEKQRAAMYRRAKEKKRKKRAKRRVRLPV